MTEVLISNNSKTNKPWFNCAPNLRSNLNRQDQLPIKSKIEPKSLFSMIIQWIKKNISPSLQDGEEIKPVMPVDSRKNRVHSKIGVSNGILFSRIKIN